MELKWSKDVILIKRPDNAFQSIMLGDPKIRLHEIGILMDLGSNFVVLEHVNSYNSESIILKCNLYLLAKEELIAQSDGWLINV
jgi:DNA-directed RNA polymerase-4 subunit 1